MKLLRLIGTVQRWRGDGVARTARVCGSDPLGAEGDTTPGEFFDTTARVLASSLPRRQVLKFALLGLAGTALASMGVKPAWARSDCRCNGVPLPQGQACCQGTTSYNPATHCCTSAGVQQKNPIENLAACPNRVPHPGWVPGDDGTCTGVPDTYGAANFLPCCLDHDHCYDTCNSSKAGCDATFHACLRAQCIRAYPTPGRQQSGCLGRAQTYFDGVSFFDRFYEAAQRNACDCCPGDQPCCPAGRVMCDGTCCDPGEGCVNGQCSGSCTSPGSCAGGYGPCAGGCICHQTTEGGACVDGTTPCASLPSCGSSGSCGPGQACFINSCCGRPVCAPICGSGFGPQQVTSAAAGELTIAGR